MFGHLILNDKHDITLIREVFKEFDITLNHMIKKDKAEILLHFLDIRNAVEGLIVHNIPFSLEVK